MRVQMCINPMRVRRCIKSMVVRLCTIQHKFGCAPLNMGSGVHYSIWAHIRTTRCGFMGIFKHLYSYIHIWLIPHNSQWLKMMKVGIERGNWSLHPKAVTKYKDEVSQPKEDMRFQINLCTQIHTKTNLTVGVPFASTLPSLIRFQNSVA